MKLNSKKFLLIIIGATLLSALSFLYWNAVSTDITAEDAQALGIIMGEKNLTAPQTLTYEAQIHLIQDIQHAVFMAAPIYKSIPANQTREPADLLKSGHGYCFDRARTLQKALTHAGFKTRYAAIYSTDQTHSAVKSLITAGGEDVKSHAVAEVLTHKGWMVVDSVNEWISLDQNNAPLSLNDLKTLAAQEKVTALKNTENAYVIFLHPFTYVYGLYARHGKYYPPYLPFPDINWREMLENL